ncbi:hypothetical protein [Nonomuraea rubra]|uniref:High-affinity K+ transport system ATPase subunit B n=1 Tax=Nonomuraea rubra TaxID=46180 RepID=A0A7X0P1C0_9ACTN|nr:hypothetical protein [Nonomuraea rubra]MBB6553463.1 high-affinity K+ transport system ATPase subunit B [Nonomuraea rubra]
MGRTSSLFVDLRHCRARAGGIQVIMVTGGHADTACAVAEKVGIEPARW